MGEKNPLLPFHPSLNVASSQDICAFPLLPARLAAGTGKGALSGMTQRNVVLFTPTLQIITQMGAQLGEPSLRARSDARRKWQR